MTESKEPRRKCLIIIAAYNESDSIERVVDDLIENHPDYDYVVINDGSTDSTASILKDRGYEYIDLKQNLGIGGAVQTGYRYALEKGYEAAVQLDGDGQHDSSYLDQITRPILEGKADYVIGSRFIEKDGYQSSLPRRIGIGFLSFLIRILCFKKAYDVTSGFRAVNRDLIREFSYHYPEDYPEPQAVMAAAMRGERILEIPVKMRERTGGTSSIDPVRSIYYMIKVSLEIVIFRIRYTGRRKR